MSFTPPPLPQCPRCRKPCVREVQCWPYMMLAQNTGQEFRAWKVEVLCEYCGWFELGKGMAVMLADDVQLVFSGGIHAEAK